jgi:uncharacterized membrane protein YqiK
MQADQRRAVEIANADTQIAVANKSREQSEADAVANEARAEAVKAEELVKTSREVAVAEREKQIQLIEAQRQAEQSAIAVRVSAAAEKDAAKDRADAVRLEADARKAAAVAEAEGKRAINEALNTLSAAQIDRSVRTELLRQLPLILQQAVKPMEKTDSIRIVQVSGMPTMAGHGGNSDGVGSGATLPEQVVNSALQYQVAKPFIEAIMKDAGQASGNLSGIAEALASMTPRPGAGGTGGNGVVPHKMARPGPIKWPSKLALALAPRSSCSMPAPNYWPRHRSVHHNLAIAPNSLGETRPRFLVARST